ncbi:MFS general substrate transporter [Mollisia scopiformis]|uniref:MFS general substrate transporter n=1 Tax=Mollisia scopiformis TaxID=149040 RepID=A0A194X8M1_MOLSC|nr:MFS general substrate transporter [Mollisia scopiformis]KUJ16132.1 MFS general substrate transporter [Mollisia scopiformis]
MASHAFGAFIDVETSSLSDQRHTIPIAPQKALPRVYHSVHSIPDPVELDNLQWGTKLNTPTGSGAVSPSGHQTPRVPMDLESRPTTPKNEQDGADALQSFSYPPMNRFRMLSVCLMNFGNGLNDSAPGALIPYIEKHYSIGYAVVSLIFVTNAIGFISAAFIVDALRAQLGRAKTLMMAQSLMTCGFVLIVCTPPFPVVVVSFFFLGLGMAINLAMGNTFAVNLHNGTKMLGAMHGSYGVGGTIGPLIATAMASTGGLLWSRYYLLALSVTLFNLVFAGWSFWHFEKESGGSLLTSIERVASQTQNIQAPKSRVKEQMASMLTAFKSKIVILGALFIFAYQGAEVSISGWVISFLIASRHGNPSAVGYVTSGFWGGITLGRFLLSHPAHKIGEKLFVYCIIAGAAAFQLLVWLVPNIIGDAVAVAIVGLLLGPVYPCATTVFSRMIARKDQVSGLSVISAFGSSGGAVAPFTTGILAQAAGTFVLHPIAIGLFTVMMVCWFILPTPRKRTE